MADTPRNVNRRACTPAPASAPSAGFDLAQGLALAGIRAADLWWRYAAYGGRASVGELVDRIAGQSAIDATEHDLIAQVLNEEFDDLGLPQFPVGYIGVELPPALLAALGDVLPGVAVRSPSSNAVLGMTTAARGAWHSWHHGVSGQARNGLCPQADDRSDPPFTEWTSGSPSPAVVVVSRELMVEGWNREAEELWGLREQETLGEHFLNLDIGLPTDRLTPLLRAVISERSQGTSLVVLARNRRGEGVSIRVTATPLAAGGVAPTGALLLMERTQSA